MLPFTTSLPAHSDIIVTDDNETRRNFSMLHRAVINEMTNEKTENEVLAVSSVHHSKRGKEKFIYCKASAVKFAGLVELRSL